MLRLKGHTLPSPSTLRRWASILTQMRTFDLQVEEKLCVISFDEMKCREEWAYDRKNDIVLEPKRMIQVAMVRGLRVSWKQPIFYNTDFKIVKDTLLFLIHEFYKIGFTVVAAVSNLDPENQTLWRSIGISPQTPYCRYAHKRFQ